MNARIRILWRPVVLAATLWATACSGSSTAATAGSTASSSPADAVTSAPASPSQATSEGPSPDPEFVACQRDAGFLEGAAKQASKIGPPGSGSPSGYAAAASEAGHLADRVDGHDVARPLKKAKGQILDGLGSMEEGLATVGSLVSAAQATAAIHEWSQGQSIVTRVYVRLRKEKGGYAC